VVVRQLLAGLQPEWEQAVVSAGKGRLAAWCEQHGFPYFSIPLFPLPRVLLGWPMLVLLLWRERPDVVFLHGQWAGPVGATACQLAGVARSVYIAHCPAFYHSNRIFRALRNYFAETIPLRCCDRVVVLSAGSWRNYIYRRWGPEEKLVKIPNGVDLGRRPGPEAGPALRADQGWKEGEFHAVFIGRLADQKRPDWLLEAWRAFLQSAPEFKGRAFLHLIGSGPERDALGGLVQAWGLQTSVLFAGEQSRPLDWISAADLVVMTSLYEGHALVPLEAMLCARPTLAMKVDGVEESIEDGQTGILVPPGDVLAFAERLRDLARDPEMRLRLAAAAGRRVDRWDWKTSLGQYRTLLRRLEPTE
jgi:glycosyltransferase involved in cell wall biosynthesis